MSDTYSFNCTLEYIKITQTPNELHTRIQNALYNNYRAY